MDNITYIEKIDIVIKRIQKNYGLYLGVASLKRLRFFLSGYDQALHDSFDIHENFNSRFQTFIEKKYSLSLLTVHWETFLSKDRSDSEALELFFLCWDEFIKEYRTNSNVVLYELTNTPKWSIHIDVPLSRLQDAQKLFLKDHSDPENKIIERVVDFSDIKFPVDQITVFTKCRTLYLTIKSSTGAKRKKTFSLN